MAFQRLGRWIIWLLCLAIVLTWIGAEIKAWRLNSTANLVVAIASVTVAGSGVADMVGTARPMRRLRERGIATTATITHVDGRYVHIPSGYSGWVTTVKVTFTNAQGETVRADYTDYEAAGRREAGQRLSIVYDPDQPDSISPLSTRPAGGAPRPNDPRADNLVQLGFAFVAMLAVAGYFTFHAFR